MTIQNDHVASFDYTLKDGDGIVIDTTDQRGPLTYLHGRQSLIPGMEKALEGCAVGDNFQTTISPEDAYGTRDESLVQQVPFNDLAHIEGLKEGSRIKAESDKGGVQIYTVILIKDDEVTLDANHPLAGITLHFDVTVKEVRAATDEELAHGHAHGPGGHQH